MSEFLEIEDKQDYVQVRYVGEFRLFEGRRTVDRINEACTKFHRSAVLLDLQSMTGNISIMDRFNIVVYGQKMIGTVSKIAIAAQPEAGTVSRLVETMAENRGINLKVFYEINQADSWLKAG